MLAAPAGADWRPIAVAVLLVLVDRALMAYRWVVLLCIVDRRRTAAARRGDADLLRQHVRRHVPAGQRRRRRRPRVQLTQLNVRGGDAVASVFMDRMLGVASLLLMALRRAAARARPRRQPHRSSRRWSLAGGDLRRDAAADLQSGAPRRRPRASWRGCRRPCATTGDGVLDSIRRYAGIPAAARQRPGRLDRGSGAPHRAGVLPGPRPWRSTLPLAIYFAFVPLILLVMLLPVTFNGIGTSQAAFVWFFGRAGVAAASGVRAFGAVCRARRRRQPARRPALRLRPHETSQPVP